MGGPQYTAGPIIGYSNNIPIYANGGGYGVTAPQLGISGYFGPDGSLMFREGVQSQDQGGLYGALTAPFRYLGEIADWVQDKGAPIATTIGQGVDTFMNDAFVPVAEGLMVAGGSFINPLVGAGIGGLISYGGSASSGANEGNALVSGITSAAMSGALSYGVNALGDYARTALIGDASNWGGQTAAEITAESAAKEAVVQELIDSGINPNYLNSASNTGYQLQGQPAFSIDLMLEPLPSPYPTYSTAPIPDTPYFAADPVLQNYSNTLPPNTGALPNVNYDSPSMPAFNVEPTLAPGSGPFAIDPSLNIDQYPIQPNYMGVVTDALMKYGSKLGNLISGAGQGAGGFATTSEFKPGSSTPDGDWTTLIESMGTGRGKSKGLAAGEVEPLSQELSFYPGAKEIGKYDKRQLYYA
jgi:hypothetical protein